MVPLSMYSSILLDLNSTFMFNEDRFGPDQDYHAAYRALGGQALSSPQVHSIIAACCEYLMLRGRDPAHFDAFPQVMEALQLLPEARGIPLPEIALLEQVIAAHELGRIPDEYAALLQRLATTHRLGIVSNIWSSKQPWLGELARAGILDLFDVVVFSSEGSSIKPSPGLFNRAIDALGVPRDQVLFIGDSLFRDVAGAAAVGLATIWIDVKGLGPPKRGPEPTWIVRDLRHLLPDEAGRSWDSSLPPNSDLQGTQGGA